MPGSLTPEKVIVPAAGDTYDYLGEQRRMANSQRTIVPVADRTEAEAIAAAMATDGRAVSDSNPLVVWNNATRNIETKTSTGWVGDWQNLTLRSGFTAGSFGTAPAIRRCDGGFQIRGVVSKTAGTQIGITEVLADLPTGFNPIAVQTFVCKSNGQTLLNVSVETTTVYINYTHVGGATGTQNFVVLDGITYS